MNNQSPFYIYISNSPISNVQAKGEDSSGKTTDGSLSKQSQTYGDSSSKENSKKNSFISKYVATRIAESVVHTAEKGISENISRIGYMQGDYVTEDKYSQLFDIGRKITNTAVTAGVAVVTGHYVVAAIGVVVSAVNSAIDVLYNTIQTNALLVSTNYNSEQLSKRAGLSSTKDGSRGTEN